MGYMYVLNPFIYSGKTPRRSETGNMEPNWERLTLMAPGCHTRRAASSPSSLPQFVRYLVKSHNTYVSRNPKLGLKNMRAGFWQGWLTGQENKPGLRTRMKS